MDETSDVKGTPDKENVNDIVDDLKHRQQELISEKTEMENDFAVKRAKFKDMYLHKEEELNLEKNQSRVLVEEKAIMERELKELRLELEETKSQVTIVECTMENELETERRKYREEIASMHRLMNEGIHEEREKLSAKFEKEIVRLRKVNEKLETENTELKSSAANEGGEGVLAVVTKTLAKKVNVLNAYSQSTEDISETMDDSMKRAKEDAEMLRSLLVPLEEEIKALKDKLRAADEQLRVYESQTMNSCKMPGTGDPQKPASQIVMELDEKVHDLSADLRAEKSSRTDLEMYVAVLQTQKTSLGDEAETVRKELKEVCALLETEKRLHNDLKQTWQMANDQFLEAQRLIMMDMRRMQNVLTTEQQRNVSELQRKDEERMEQEKRVQFLTQLREEQERAQIEAASSEAKKESSSKINSNGTGTSLKSKFGIPSSPILSRFSPRNLRRKSPSPKRGSLDSRPQLVDGEPSPAIVGILEKPEISDDITTTEGQQLADSSAVDLESLPSLELLETVQPLPQSTESSGVYDGTTTEVESSLEKSGSEASVNSCAYDYKQSSFKLTEAQLNALSSDFTASQEDRKQLLLSARASIESTSLSPADKRLSVGDKEWNLLQDELKKARDKLGKPCDMCSNYEAQLQSEQEKQKDIERQWRTSSRLNEHLREDIRREQEFRKDAENRTHLLASNFQKNLSDVQKVIEEKEIALRRVISAHNSFSTDVQAQLQLLSQDRDLVQGELTRLQHENEVLVGKHSAQAAQMQNEVINLPTNPEDMQEYLLRYREELICAKVAKEHAQESLKSEIMFLKEQLASEQNIKDTMEESLSAEINALREQVGILESIRTQLDSEHSKRTEVEKSCRDLQEKLGKSQAKSKQILGALNKETEEHKSTKSKFDDEICTLKSKVSVLARDLENSEVVQKDFVKLSQELQMQLEKMRAAETEVRWQHEEDVEVCNGCQQSFSVTRRKHHCRHCIKLFCADCIQKTVQGGPSKRANKVCDVCYTLLMRDTAPYFSTESSSHRTHQ